jgi:hypothetical protein
MQQRALRICTWLALPAALLAASGSAARVLAVHCVAARAASLAPRQAGQAPPNATPHSPCRANLAHKAEASDGSVCEPPSPLVAAQRRAQHGPSATERLLIAHASTLPRWRLGPSERSVLT